MPETGVLEEPGNLYLYNGKELNTDLGLDWSDYGARWYDGSVGRWWSVDKLADHPNQINKSPYAYAWNNPVLLTDPDGNCPQCLVGGFVGGISEIGIQVLGNIATGQKWNKIDFADVGVAAIAGAATGGLAAANNVRKGLKLASAIAGGTAGQVFEAGVDANYAGNGKMDLEVVGMQAIFPDGKTTNIVGIDITVKGKKVYDTALDLAFDKVGDFMSSVGDAIKNGGLKKELKNVDRELSKSMKGSKGEADRLKQKASLEKEIGMNKKVIDHASDHISDQMKNQVKDN